MPKPLPEELLDLLRKPSPCFIATLMPDGSPQLTQTWVTTDGEHVVINVVDGHQKAQKPRPRRAGGHQRRGSGQRVSATTPSAVASST